MKPHYQRLFYRWGYTSRTFTLLEHAVKFAGRRLSNTIARQIANFYSATHPGVVETVRRNLLLLNASATTRHARAVFRNFAVGLSDYWLCGLLPVAKTSAWCRERSGMEHLQKARAAGRGAILATGHFGLFEYGALLLAEKNLPISVLTLSEPTPELTRWRADFRRRWGAETIEIRRDPFSSLRVVEALQANRFCAMLVDRPFDGPSIECPVPHGQIPFSLSAALLAHLADCPILPVTVQRLPDASYRLVTHAPIFVDRSLPRQKALESMTREMATVLAADFADAPEQWYHFAPVSAPR